MAKRLTRPALERKLWKAFSKYIRLRDSENGIGRCISCHKPISVFYFLDKIRFNPQAHAGHYYNRGSNYKALKFDEKNVNLQCCHCNTFNEGNKQGYRKGLVRKYGKKVLQYLEIKKKNKCTLGYGELEIMLKHYQQKLKEEKERHGLQ